MEQRVVEKFEDMFNLYSELVRLAKWAKTEMQKRQNDPEYCADMAFAFYEMDKLWKDVGIEIRKVKELGEQVASLTHMRNSLKEGPIRTEYVTATPNIKMQPKMPAKDSPEMYQLLEWLGIEDESKAIVRLHWPTLCDMITERVAESEPLPPGIDVGDMHNPKASLTFRKKRNLSDNV